VSSSSYSPTGKEIRTKPPAIFQTTDLIESRTGGSRPQSEFGRVAGCRTLAGRAPPICGR